MIGMADIHRRHNPAALPTNARAVPADVRSKIERAERTILGEEPLWEESLAFFDGDSYVEVSAVTNKVDRVETREGGAKPRWRSRLRRNRHNAAIERLRSRFAARIPVPVCSAPSHNAEAINAAKLAEKVLLSLYRKLKIKRLFLDAMVYTFNCGAAYIWPYWDGNTGSFIEDPGQPVLAEDGVSELEPAKPRLLRTGEVGFEILGPSEVLYEPGTTFDKSRWYGVRQAKPVEDVKAWEDYDGPEDLRSDAAAAGRTDPTAAELVFVYHYLERPSKKTPAGRWLRFANGVEIAPKRDYPHDQDVPVLHPLEDISRRHRPRPLGRGMLMVDIQRAYERTSNQIAMWAALALQPTLLAPKGSIRKPRTGQPGEVIEARAVGGVMPSWMPIQEIPVGLFKILDLCISDWREVTGEGDLPAGLESGSAVAQVRNEQDESRRATFAENLADCYSSVFEHTLYLVQRHYTEPRLLEVKTRFGTESIPDFLGAKLCPGITVNVDPGSVQPRTREAQEAKLIMYAERGWIAPHQVMAALRAGDVDALIDEYELDVARAQRHIQQLMALGRGEEAPVPFAGPMDNHEVALWLIGAWMKTEDFERQPDLVKQATLALYDQHNAELRWQAFEEQMRVEMSAADKGMHDAANGSSGGGEAPPSLPSMESTVRGLQGTPQRDGT